MIFGLGTTSVDQVEPSVPTESPRSGRERERERGGESNFSCYNRENI